jgi:hypothetical protein
MTGSETDAASFPTPTIEHGVRGPRNEFGLLLRAPYREELAWDIEMEIVSARREWVQERQAWWVATAYLQTLVVLVLRSYPSVLVLGPDEDRLISRDAIDAIQGRLL